MIVVFYDGNMIGEYDCNFENTYDHISISISIYRYIDIRG